MAFDGNVSDLITQEAQDQGVDPGLALSIGRAESGLNANVKDSPKGARGVMQVMQGTAPGYDLTDTAANIRAGVRQIKTLSDRYNGDHALVAAAYNAGPGAVDKHGGVPPFPETQAYVAKVTGQPAASDVMADFEKTQSQAAPGSVTVSDVHPATPEELAQPTDAAPDDAAVMADFEKAQAKAPPPADAAPPATAGGVAAQTAQGAVNSTIAGGNSVLAPTPFGQTAHALDFLPAMSENLGALIHAGVTGQGHIPTAQEFFKPALDMLGGSSSQPTAPQFVGEAQNFPERAGRFVGTLLPAAAMGPDGATGLLDQLAYRAKNVAYPALTGTAAGEGVKAMGGTPQEVTLAQMVGSLPGSVAAIPNALEGLGNIAGNVAKPFLANVSTGARESQAGQILANASGSGFKPAVSALEGYTPHVEGSPSTIGDVTGNLGLIDLSRGVVSKNPALNAGLVEGQASARQASLAKLNTNASPSEAADHIRSTVANLDARTQADVEAATAKARAATDAVGGNATADTNGATIRDAVTTALKKSDAQEAALHEAIDPDGTLTGNVGSSRLAAKSIAGQLTQDDRAMTAEEKGIFDRVAAWPDILPLKNIIGMRKQINAVASEAKLAGNDVTYGRLSALRSAIGENMATTIGDAVVKSGANAKVQSWLDGSEPATEVATGTAGGPGGNDQPAGGSDAVSASGGAALPSGGGSGSSASAQGVSGEVSSDLKPVVMGGKVVAYTTPSGQNISATMARSYRPAEPLPPPNALNLQPTIDDAAKGRIGAANAHTADQAITYRQGPVAKVLKTANGYAGQYALPNGGVPGEFFQRGPEGYESMQALAKASPEAMPAIQDYAAATLRDMATDGVITPKVLQRWQARYGDSIRALPADMQAKFADAAKAGQTVADAVTTRAAALKSAQSGAIGKIMGAQTPDAVVKTVAGILRGTNAESDMRTLVAATRSNPQALAGLKQAVVDHITTNFITNTEAGASGVNKISADKFQTFLKTAGPALREVLKPDEFNRLTAIGRDIQQSQRTLQATKLAGQSNTAQDFYKGGLPHGGKPSTALDVLGTILGGAALPHTGFAGEVIGGALTDLVQRLRLSGINKVNDLVTAAVFNPKQAAALMQRVKGPQDLTAQSAIGRAILKAFAAPGIAVNTANSQPTAPSALEGVR